VLALAGLVLLAAALRLYRLEDRQFDSPYGIAVDGEGDVFVSDHADSRVHKLTSDGALLTTFGSAGSGESQFQSPRFLTVDGGGNVYVTGYTSHRVKRFDNDGNLLRMCGWGVDDGTVELKICANASTPCHIGQAGSGVGQLYGPSDIVVDRAGNLYVVESSSHSISQFDTDGNYVATLGSNGYGNSDFWHPSVIAVDGYGDLYVVDLTNMRIRKFDGEAIALMAYLPVVLSNP